MTDNANLAAQPPESASPPASRTPNLTDRKVMAVITVIALHILIYWLGIWPGALMWLAGRLGLAPRNGSTGTLLTVSLFMAWCSLGAIWWATSRWPSHAKTLLTVVAGLIVWALLVMTVDSSNLASDESAGWCALVATQGIVTALGILLVDYLRRRSAESGKHRFTILYLMIWTTVVGLLLGGARVMVVSLGWTPGVFQWLYFLQLQVVALFNSLLGISLWTTLEVRRSWKSRLVACGFITLSVMFIANVLLAALFQNVGADVFDICWLYGAQAAFLLVTLVPLKGAAIPAQDPHPPGI